ncbi:MAG: hypothetical protein DWQ08_10080 [Proteobacteria bacterium]|nr:MAG: hypothetical protein DWQ08_10080 [Pseudomonadota bacterium]
MESGNEVLHTYAVAGVRVTTNRAADLPVRGHTDCMVRVRFGELGADFDEPDTHVRIETSGGPDSAAWLRRDGCSACLRDQTDRPDYRARQIRSVIPFAAALQGRVVLHASATMIAGRVIGFVAESGAGKSTLAASFAAAGSTPVADDLLPCRVQDGRIIVPVESSGDTTHPPLTTVCFLSRNRRQGRLTLERLPSRECLRRLLRLGFGELANRGVWATQFEVYGAIARRTDAFDLVIPDDMATLPRVATALRRKFDEQDRLIR